MPRINLLPWREEQRKERQKNFAAAAVGALVLGAGMVFAAIFFTNKAIEYQNARNEYLKKEIEFLDEQIKEIEELETQKERLLARMEIIEQLQKSRPEIVHLFEELVTTLPDGVYLTLLEQTGTQLQLKGVAQSQTRVSNYMRQINASAWMTQPDLGVITTVEGERTKTAEFTLTANQASPNSDEEETP